MSSHMTAAGRAIRYQPYATSHTLPAIRYQPYALARVNTLQSALHLIQDLKGGLGYVLRHIQHLQVSTTASWLHATNWQLLM
jgi:hypothetical protein